MAYLGAEGIIWHTWGRRGLYGILGGGGDYMAYGARNQLTIKSNTIQYNFYGWVKP